MNKKGDGNAFWVIIAIIIALLVLLFYIFGPNKMLSLLFGNVERQSKDVGSELNKFNLSESLKTSPSAIQGSLVKIESFSSDLVKTTESFIYLKQP